MYSIDWNKPQNVTNLTCSKNQSGNPYRQRGGARACVALQDGWRGGEERRKGKTECEGSGKRRGDPADEWTSGGRRRGERGAVRPSSGLMEHGSGFRILPLQWVSLLCGFFFFFFHQQHVSIIPSLYMHYSSYVQTCILATLNSALNRSVY